MWLRSGQCAVRMALIICMVVPLTIAHGSGGGTDPDMHTDVDGHGHSTDKVAHDAENILTYFAHKEHTALLYSHITLMTISWVFILPIAVMLSLARSRFLLACQLIFTVTNASGVTLAAIYNSRTPDLYPSNAHHKVGWLATVVTTGQVLFSLLVKFARRARTRKQKSAAVEGHAFLPSSLSSQTCRDNSILDIGNRRIRDSNANSQRTSSSSTIRSELNDYSDSSCKDVNDVDDDLTHQFSDLSHRAFAEKCSWMDKILLYLPRRIISYDNIVYQSIDRIILPLGFIAVMTGIATLGRFFEGKAIYGGLAHWAKGGVFFWLGSLTLGRWSGSFGELGWAWNVVPRRPTRWRISAEFVESALIFFYGVTNVFLEHLGNWGGSWSAQDFEHIAITILFIGGGACGMLVESTRVRDLLNVPTLNVMVEKRSSDEENKPSSSSAPGTYQFSQNPIPALVILLLGAMMSSHHQSTVTSTMVHKQWGQLLTGAAISRVVTYLLICLRPPTSFLPSRPPTELLASFGLMAGGLVFMSSAADMVDGMVRYQLDAMFVYTITMGLVGLLMAWELVVIAVKGLATRHEHRVVRGHNSGIALGVDGYESCNRDREARFQF